MVPAAGVSVGQFGLPESLEAELQQLVGTAGGVHAVEPPVEAPPLEGALTGDSIEEPPTQPGWWLTQERVFRDHPSQPWVPQPTPASPPTPSDNPLRGTHPSGGGVSAAGPPATAEGELATDRIEEDSTAPSQTVAPTSREKVMAIPRPQKGGRQCQPPSKPKQGEERRTHLEEEFMEREFPFSSRGRVLRGPRGPSRGPTGRAPRKQRLATSASAGPTGRAPRGPRQQLLAAGAFHLPAADHPAADHPAADRPGDSKLLGEGLAEAEAVFEKGCPAPKKKGKYYLGMHSDDARKFLERAGVPAGQPLPITPPGLGRIPTDQASAQKLNSSAPRAPAGGPSMRLGPNPGVRMPAWHQGRPLPFPTGRYALGDPQPKRAAPKLLRPGPGYQQGPVAKRKRKREIRPPPTQSRWINKDSGWPF